MQFNSPSQPGIKVYSPLNESSLNFGGKNAGGNTSLSHIPPMNGMNGLSGGVNGMNFSMIRKRRKSSRSSDQSGKSGSMGICSDMIIIKENNKKITS